VEELWDCDEEDFEQLVLDRLQSVEEPIMWTPESEDLKGVRQGKSAKENFKLIMKVCLQ
jgi:hypothetical protein